MQPPTADPRNRGETHCGPALGQAWRPHSVLSRPAQRPARGSSPGATRWVHGLAADRGVAVVHERIDDDVVLGGVVDQLVERPGRERVDLDHPVLLVPVDERRVGPQPRVLAADAGDPGLVPLERLGERLDLAHLAAQAGVACEQVLAELGVLLRDGALWRDVDDAQLHRRLDGVTGADGLGEVVAGVEEQGVDPGEVLGDDVGEDGVRHRAGDRGAVAELLGDPRQHLVGGGVGQADGCVFRECLQLVAAAHGGKGALARVAVVLLACGVVLELAFALVDQGRRGARHCRPPSRTRFRASSRVDTGAVVNIPRPSAGQPSTGGLDPSGLR